MFEKILSELSNLGWVFADYYPDETAIHKVTKKSVAYDEVVAIVQEVAKEYEKRNCHNCQYETTPGDCEPCCFCKSAYGDDCFKPKDAPYQKGE